MVRNKERIKPFMKWLTKIWLNHPDLRFGQMLINEGIVSDDIRTWNLELCDYNIPHEVARGIHTWGTRGKDLMDKMKYLFIKDLETNHIKAILKTQTHISEVIRKFLKDELKFRENRKV